MKRRRSKPCNAANRACRWPKATLRTETHDYYRHGTVTLFAALDYLEGKVLARTAPKHTTRQWLEFLKQLDRQTLPGLELHLILDNYATHKHAKVKAWLAKRPRCHRHFVPDRALPGSTWWSAFSAT